MFRTHDELLEHFMKDGDLLEKDTGCVYIADCNMDGEFFGIMVSDPVPEEKRGSVHEAVAYALDHFPAPGSGARDRMLFMEAPGYWFGKLADNVICEPENYMALSYED